MKGILILQFIFILAATGQEIHFIKEDITFQIKNGSFLVDGYYWFYNPSSAEAEKSIYFPFGTFHSADIVDSMEIFNITKRVVPDISNLTNTGFSFVLDVPRRDTVTIRIQYRQKIFSDSVMYVLRSTQHWQKPLESAEYRLMVEKQMDITAFSIVPDKIYSIQNNNIYYWKRVQYMPEKDMVFHFKHVRTTK